MYNMDTNTWTTSVIQAAKRRYGGLTVGCAGLIWSFGGDASSEFNKAVGINSEIWTWTGDLNVVKLLLKLIIATNYMTKNQ